MIKEFHIHLYYTSESIHYAKELCELISTKFSVSIGRFHEKNVGPHPMWSVQILVEPDLFGDVLSFVALKRKDLIVFSHPVTGDDLKDHRDYAIWMGEIRELNLSIFK
ncbi:DOPA 4,5-dioxygenase family protein [Halobacteriovorax sp. HLS]|uniref:DOPA 4,5-dioxygenase family protein n=1 Tax=Halobacteriovorax sp. HLS TaxID=2234000 RepID=UPI000FD6E075|nr:DOPA 4,5-dioxygenase family protein [Halobacteriovorax sp. HLS]